VSKYKQCANLYDLFNYKGSYQLKKHNKKGEPE